MLKTLSYASLITAMLLGLPSATEASGSALPGALGGVVGQETAIADSGGSDRGPLDDGRGTDFVVERSDNICGLEDPRTLTRPALVDHAKLIALTPQMRRMKREKINPNSALGIHLRTDAAKMVTRACEKVRGDKSFCSVWKKIRRRDGKKIADITALVKRQLGL